MQTMTREQALEYIKSNPAEILRPAKKRGTYICPLCKNGTGKTGDGMTTKDGIHYTCFKCHDIENESIIDIIGKMYGLTENKDMIEKAYELYNIDIEKDIPKQTTTPADRQGQQAADQPAQIKSRVLNFNNVIEDAHKALLDNKEALSYITGRGIDIDTIKRFKIGYSAQGHNALLKDYPELKTGSHKEHLYNYVFPYNDGRGFYRYFKTEISDRTQIDDYNQKYNNLKDTPQPYYNEYYLTDKAAGIIFLTEGIYDALSVEVAGYKAIGGIATGINRLTELCEKHKDKDHFYIIALDNDEPGKAAANRLAQAFKEAGIGYMIRPAADYKDFNEHLTADKDGFLSFIGKAYKDAYKRKIGAGTLQDLEDEINTSRTEAALSTGFRELDDIIDDGIRKGLYVIGAISSLGKTTFTLQVADHIAKQGTDVLFFSLEMSAAEIMAKSISRETLDISLLDTGDTKTAKTTLGIINGRRQAQYTDSEKQTVNKAIQAYKAYQDHIYIIEGRGSMTVKTIAETAQKHYAFTGSRPVIVIDYLQILQPYPETKGSTDKQIIDRNILELKRLSRTYTVIAVSSFNRASYDEPVNLASFKESGALEYTSDILIGLQYKGMDFQKKSADKWENENEHKSRVKDLLEQQKKKAKAGEAQDIECKILKNRNGSRDNIILKFYPMFNLFRDADNPNDRTQPDGNNSQRAINPSAVPFQL